MTAVPLYRAPWFLALSRLAPGAWAVHSSALSLQAEAGGAELGEDLARLALACLPPAAARAALRVLLAVGLWVRTPAGYQLREVPAEVAPSSLPSGPLSAAERKRRQRDRARDNAPPSSRDMARDIRRDMAVTAPVTHGVTAANQAEERAPESAPAVVTFPVTAPAPLACARGGEILSSPIQSLKEEGEEDRISPLPPSVTGSVTGAPEALPPSAPSRPSPLPPPVPGMAALGSLAALGVVPPVSLPADRLGAVCALWAEVTGREAGELRQSDRDAIRVRLEERAGLEDFRAAFRWAMTCPRWFPDDPSRRMPAVVCGDRLWAECVRKGKAAGKPAPAGPPSKPPAPPPVAPPPAPPPPPETLPWAPPASPTRCVFRGETRYYPIPAEGIYLRADLWLARQEKGAA